MAEGFLSFPLLLVHLSEQRATKENTAGSREENWGGLIRKQARAQNRCEVVDRPRNRAEKDGGSRANGHSVLINRTNLRDAKPRALCRTAPIGRRKSPLIAPACRDVKIQLMGPIPDKGRNSIEFDLTWDLPPQH